MSAASGKQLIAVVKKILDDEIKGRVAAAMSKVTRDYAMTWVYQQSWKYKKSDGKLFPRTSPKVRKELEEVYLIKGRKYDIRNMVAGKDVVMVEMVESYPDPKTKQMYRTPLVIVLEFKGNKIRRGRHYCDPRLSFAKLTRAQVAKLYK
jgi:ketosteroid isomerase-like protein